MSVIHIVVRDKVATAAPTTVICDNTDYNVIFSFDSEWDAHPYKTMRVQQGGEYTDVIFEGNVASLPQITAAGLVKVGVFAGDLSTTTPAQLNAAESILSDSGSPAAPQEDVYAQIMALLDQLGELPHANGLLYADGKLYLAQDGEAVGEGIAISGGTGDHTQLSNRDAADQHPIAAITGLSSALDGKQPTGNYLTEAALTAAIDDALAQAKESGEFDGAPGQDGAPGEKGDKGDKGDTGETGPTGPQGPQGATGATGETGSQGPAGADGQDGQDGYTPQKGVDYFTAADKAELVSDVLAALPSAEGVYF